MGYFEWLPLRLETLARPVSTRRGEGMTVGELKKLLEKYPDDYDIMIPKRVSLGNCLEVHTVYESTYGFFGLSLPCVMLDQEGDEEE
jgi:hypothetical protein